MRLYQKIKRCDDSSALKTDSFSPEPYKYNKIEILGEKMKLIDKLKDMSTVNKSAREDLVESINIQNYGSGQLSETDMWILRQAATDEKYLKRKLQEAEDLGLDLEVPSETDTAEDDELSLDFGDDESEDDDDFEDGDFGLDDESEDDEFDLGDDESEDDESEEEYSPGIGILPLIAEIQEKLANGKPSAVEIAALNAIRKLIK